MGRVQMLSQQPAVKDSIQIPIYNHKSKQTVYNQGGGTDAIVNTMQLETVTQAFLNQQNDASFDKWFSKHE